MMTPRGTTTGRVLEKMILPALEEGGYTVQKQVLIGSRLGCGRHVVDVIAEKGDNRYLVSLKWQQTTGTAEQKVPYEVICLAEAVRERNDAKAYIVLGGEGWSLRDFYVGGGLTRHLARPEAVTILTLEAFVAKANQGRL